MIIRMLVPPPVDIRYAGISYRVEPAAAADDGSSFVIARPLTASGEPSCLNPAQLLSLDVTDAVAAWSRGFPVNDHFFLPLSLVARLVEERIGEEVKPSRPSAAAMAVPAGGPPRFQAPAGSRQ